MPSCRLHLQPRTKGKFWNLAVQWGKMGSRVKSARNKLQPAGNLADSTRRLIEEAIGKSGLQQCQHRPHQEHPTHDRLGGKSECVKMRPPSQARGYSTLRFGDQTRGRR